MQAQAQFAQDLDENLLTALNEDGATFEVDELQSTTYKKVRPPADPPRDPPRPRARPPTAHPRKVARGGHTRGQPAPGLRHRFSQAVFAGASAPLRLALSAFCARFGALSMRFQCAFDAPLSGAL